MPYVMKDNDGRIVATSTIETNASGWVFVDSSDETYLAFLEAELQASHPFRESDIQLARVLEDLISLLIDRDLIRFTDFPDAAQKRLVKRQNMRANKQLSLIDDDILI